MEKLVATPQGDARLIRRTARGAIAELVVTHGAGGGIDAPDLVRLAEDLPRNGITVSRVEMPWRVQGKKLAPRPALIDEAYRAVLQGVRPKAPFVLGGRSAGARSACRIGAEMGAQGVLALSFPLHPPGRPEKSRLDELLGAAVPVLVVQGGNDPFGRPEEFPEGTELAVVPDADHGMKVPKRAALDQAGSLGLIVEATLEWIVRDVAGNR
ncbi:alpha/beta family hydrolase [Nocardioides marmorisolisilvae]|uniref:Hydrolase n=1 Tax=Nocardioides marmorisolisilvae TaxID=1542737 RepID=A0A3N0DX95_9ACTN|nr:alpha/beta family hydrolase [Nocardioides marmorisolisilvae]RNL80073.1 hydrolase [Nocardioides marmorisolisilvae]